eukprot:1143617-Pelagomonas_calceolata.AAC.3
MDCNEITWFTISQAKCQQVARSWFTWIAMGSHGSQSARLSASRLYVWAMECNVLGAFVLVALNALLTLALTPSASSAAGNSLQKP